MLRLGSNYRHLEVLTPGIVSKKKTLGMINDNTKSPISVKKRVLVIKKKKKCIKRNTIN